MDNSIQLQYVNIEDLLPGKFQAHFENIGDNLDNLINSIQKYGIIVPLIVREKGINQYEIILGNRRYSAARQIGLQKIPVIIINVDDEKALDIVISENIQRKELSAKEEAYLYEKDLEYTNDNEEKLSSKLGIPIDRILSKLSFIRKNNQQTLNQPLSNNIETSVSNIQTKSSVNQDIISLNELNKEEREDFNMNNDIINNQNLNTDPSKAPQQPQEPTFGGRFFPSLEDAPTNMNMNQSIESFNNNDNTQQSSSLIDLTGDNNNETEHQTPENNESFNANPPQNIPDNNSVNNIESMDQTTNFNDNQIGNIQEIADNQQEQPAVPNLDALSTNIPDNNVNINNNNPIQENNINSNPESINTEEQLTSNNINQNISNDNLSQINNDVSQNQQPIIEDNNNINNVPEQQEIVTSNIEESNNTIPENTPETVSQPTNIGEQQLVQEQNIPQDISNEINNANVNSPKDIIPVVNMIKSLAVNIENLGYKLNITENDNEGSYEINIEVEK